MLRICVEHTEQLANLRGLGYGRGDAELADLYIEFCNATQQDAMAICSNPAAAMNPTAVRSNLCAGNNVQGVTKATIQL